MNNKTQKLNSLDLWLLSILRSYSEGVAIIDVGDGKVKKVLIENGVEVVPELTQPLKNSETEILSFPFILNWGSFEIDLSENQILRIEKSLLPPQDLT